MTEVTHAEEPAAGLGKETTAETEQTPAEQIKQDAIEAEEKVADGSNGPISTNPEEAHAHDKDNASYKTASTVTTNGADDNASMIPLGKGPFKAEPLGDGEASTGNATPATVKHNTADTNDSTTANADTSNDDHRMNIASQIVGATRKEIDEAKHAIIRAVANCKLTREVVFQAHDVGTEDGRDEVKRVLGGYSGIDEALSEMNRDIPVHVRHADDLGLSAAQKLKEEEAHHGDNTSASATTTAQNQDQDKNLTDVKSSEPTDAALVEKASQGTTQLNDTAPTGVAGNDSETLKEALADGPVKSEAVNGDGDGLSPLQQEELNRVPDADTEKEATADSAVTEDSLASLAPATVPDSSEDIAADSSTLPATTDANNDGDNEIVSSSTSDKGKGRAIEDENTSTTATSAPKSPTQGGERLADKLKREVEERARRGQLGVFNKPLNSNASTAKLNGETAKPSEASTSGATDTSAAQAKDAQASSAFTEEFGPGETGLTAPSSPTAATGATRPPSTRARSPSISSQTSTGGKQGGLLGLFRRRSKRQSIGAGSTTDRRASQDLGRSVSRDTTASATPATSSAVPPAPEKAVETIDTAKPVETIETTPQADADAGGITSGAGVETSVAGEASDEVNKKEEEPILAGNSAVTAEEPATAEVEESIPADKSVQTTEEDTTAAATEPVTYIEEPAPSAAADSVVDHQAKDIETGTELPKEAAAAAVLVATGELGSGSAHPASTEEKTPELSNQSSKLPNALERTRSVTAEKGTSTDPEETAANTIPAKSTATPVFASESSAAQSSTPSPTLERRDSKSKGGFFGLFRRRSSRNSSGPLKRSTSDAGNVSPVAATSAHDEPQLESTAADTESPSAGTGLEGPETVVGKDAEDIPNDNDEIVDVDTPVTARGEDVTESKESNYPAGAIVTSDAVMMPAGPIDTTAELETVEEEHERANDESVADDEEDTRSVLEPQAEERAASFQSAQEGLPVVGGETVKELDAGEVLDSGADAAPVVTQRSVSSPVVAQTPAERMLGSGSERRKSRGGLFGLFRSKSRKDKEAPPNYKDSQYASVVRNMGVVDSAPVRKDVAIGTDDDTQSPAVAVGTEDDSRSPAVDGVGEQSTSVRSIAGNESFIDHERGSLAEEHHGARADSIIESEPEVPDNRSITEIAASIPLPAPVYTDKTRAKHERLRKKRDHEEFVERERIRHERELLEKRERILTAYTGKQDFSTVPKPRRTKNFGHAHERKDLDGVQYVKKSDKKAAKKEDLVKTVSRGSSVDEPSSPHPASGGLAGSFPAEKSTSRVSTVPHYNPEYNTEPSSPSTAKSPVIRLVRRVSSMAHKREKSVEPVAA